MSDSSNSEISPIIKERMAMICGDKRYLGCGIVIGSNGLVVTCRHVIANVSKLQVKLGSRFFQPTIYRVDEVLDLAFLKISEQLPFYGNLTRSTKNKLQQKVLCYSFLNPTTNRKITFVSVQGKITKIKKDAEAKICSIQINAALENGFSGGPVVDASSGELIGLIVSRKGEIENRCIPVDAIFSSLADFEVNSHEFNWQNYANKLISSYKDGNVFRNYIDLQCRTSKSKKDDAKHYILNVWLPDKDKPLLTVLGDFGTGKTLLCHRIAYKLASDYISKNRKVMMPVVLKLGDALQFKNVRDFISDRIAAALDTDLTWQQIELLLRSGKILLIFDGFDEMTMRAGSFQIIANFNALRDMIIPGSKAILTCRTHYFGPKETELHRLSQKKEPDYFENLVSEEGNADQTSIIYLESLSDENVKTYLKNEVGNEWRKLFKLIKKRELYNLYDLSKRPIFLNIIAETIPGFQSTGRKINGTRLYQMYTEQCFLREGRKLSINSVADEHAKAKYAMKIVEEIAFQLYADNCTYLSSTFIAEMSNKLQLIDQQLDQFLRKCPFFKPSAGTEANLIFIHQSFFEFFVADKIARDIENRKHDSYKAEYLTPQIDKYLFDLLEIGKNIKIISAWLSRHPNVNLRMNCALTLGRWGNKKFIPFLEKCLRNEKDIGVGGRISEALAALGSENAIEDFLKNLERYSNLTEETGKSDNHRLLYDVVDSLTIKDPTIIDKLIEYLSNPNSRIRKYAVFSLGRIGSKDSVASLIDVLNKENETIRTRRYAAAALGLIGDKQAILALQETILLSENEFLRAECLKAIKRIQQTENTF